ncbi:hypothetical protein CEXT_249021 [Caerostris extrusa]|uniref:Ribosomal protein S12 n=1 Tax=Caerostris extrusa TaxID=172846 RepID=A0AAV4RG92_CAEEX|nr:hypothetical protein CEXT_249021 [Caerostris extrusa]
MKERGRTKRRYRSIRATRRLVNKENRGDRTDIPTGATAAAARNSIAKFSLINPHANFPEAACLSFQKPPTQGRWQRIALLEGWTFATNSTPWERNGKDTIIVLGVIGGDGVGLNSRGVLVFLKEEGEVEKKKFW